MGMKLAVGFDSFNHKFVMNVKGQISHNLELGSDPLGNITRISNTLDAMQGQNEDCLQKLGNVEKQLENAKIEKQKNTKLLEENIENKRWWQWWK